MQINIQTIIIFPDRAVCIYHSYEYVRYSYLLTDTPMRISKRQSWGGYYHNTSIARRPHLDLRESPVGTGVGENAQVKKLEGLGKLALDHAQPELLGEGHIFGVRKTLRRNSTLRAVGTGTGTSSGTLLGNGRRKLEPTREEAREIRPLLGRHLSAGV